MWLLGSAVGNVLKFPGDTGVNPAQRDAEGETMNAANPIAEHLEDMRQRGLAPSTIYRRKRGLVRLQAYLRPVPLVDATPAMLLRWRAGLRLTDESVILYVGDAREFFRWLVARGLRADNPAAAVPRPRAGRRLPRPIGEEPLFKALASAPDRIRPWFVLAAWSGLRAKEIAFLRRPQVLEREQPPVLVIAQGATKGRRERIVPMSDFVVGELIAAGLPASGWVFRRHDGGRGPNQPHTVSHLCNKHLHESGATETLHQLRHRFGTQSYRQGHDLRVVQELMGHSKPETTAGYAAYDQTSAAATVQALPVPRHLQVVTESGG